MKSIESDGYASSKDNGTCLNSNSIGRSDAKITRRPTVVLTRSRATDPTVDKFAHSLSIHGFDVDLLLWNRNASSTIMTNGTYRASMFNFTAPQDRFGALFYLPIWWCFEFFYILKRKPDYVHAYDLDTLPPAVLVKFIKRNKLIYTIGDFYSNNLPNGRPLIIRRMIRKIVASMEQRGTRFADALFLADECRQNELGEETHPNIRIMYNSPPDYPAKKQERDSSDTPLTIFYCGVISKSRGLEYAIDAVRALKGVRLVIAGTGPESEIIKALSTSTDNVVFLGWLPSYEDVIANTMKADILFRFSDPKVPKTYYESPNKLFEAMMCGKPIIVSDGSSMARIVVDRNCGIVVPFGDVAAIRDAISALNSNLTLRKQLGENGRLAYERSYSWSIMEKRLIDAYNCDSAGLR